MSKGFNLKGAEETVKSRLSSVAIATFRGPISLSERFQPSTCNVQLTKIILPNYVNIKSLAGAIRRGLNREGVSQPGIDRRLRKGAAKLGENEKNGRFLRFEDQQRIRVL
jgi:hypothetical protein